MTPTTTIDDLAQRTGRVLSARALAREGILDARTLARIRRGRPVRRASLRRLAAWLGLPLDVVEMAVRVAAAERAA